MSYQFSTVNSLLKRLDFSKIELPNFPLPNLKGIQIEAYNNFLKDKLEVIVKNYFPLISNSKNTQIALVGIEVVEPTITEQEAIKRSFSLQNEIYLNVNLINEQSKDDKKITEGRVFLGNMPVFSSASNFIINGIEKFVISQIVRSPGLYVLSKSQIKLSNARKRTQEGIICELLPSKGVLILFHYVENKNIIKIVARNSSGDNAPQFPATTLLKAFGISNRDIQEIFRDDPCIENTLSQETFNSKSILNDPIFRALFHEVSTAKNLQKVIDSSKGTVQQTLFELFVKFCECHGEKTQDLLNKLTTLSINENKSDFKIVKEQLDKEVHSAAKLLEAISVELAAKFFSSELGISGDASKTGIFSYQQLVWSYLFDKNYYSLLPAGRYKVNYKLSLSQRIYKKILAEDVFDISGNLVFPKNTYMNADNFAKFKELSSQKKLKITKKLNINSTGSHPLHETLKDLYYEQVSIYIRSTASPIVNVIASPAVNVEQSINPSDIIAILSYVTNIKHKVGNYDDIDHLGNKRLRLVSELLEGRLQLAMSRIQKFAIEKMNNLEARINYFALKNSNTDSFFTVHAILNTKPFQIVVKEFFNSHQLTQFLDQQNPLSELTNKRKISAMGPGGIKREDPNLVIRDVHYSHYGRICPIETPEGMNIGLIMALASYAKIDEFGFINTPYYKVKDSKVTNEVHWLNALEENNFNVVEAISPKDKDQRLISPVTARSCQSVDDLDASNVHFVDVSCNQLVSISVSLIPFLEHDDANRVLMGANMQRQAVPLLKPHSPIVGTGVEHKIACDSEIARLAKSDGVIKKSDGNSVVVEYSDKNINDEYIDLIKFSRSNQNTCKNQNSQVKPGQIVKKGDVLVNGHAMQNGELALGQNVLVAFSTWHGYNYEDAIILSSRLYEEDTYTSIHIQEYTVECMRTKIGDEEITRQIPNCLSENKKYLDEDGLIIVGAKVKEGDILVGKISPNAKNDQSPEEKLLQAIFSEKARSVRDSSLKVPSGGDGIVSGILRFSIFKGDKLNDDVIELVKVFVTQKRKIQVGDKMAGRHGNKGIVSKIAPVADMPYLEDGTPIDILLNPLGVPSRMNIGQALETYLGFAARTLVMKKLLDFYFEKNEIEASKVFGLFSDDVSSLFEILGAYLQQKGITKLEVAKAELKQIDLSIILCQAGLKYEDLDIKVLTPIFSGCKHDDLVNIMKESGLDIDKNDGKFILYDGKTGEKFKKPMSVGVIYMLKLNHMVDDKIYSRSVGPYSKITQQPLGGKCQNGGQRFGEMEVWALEAYGAAYNLQELLTLKSDDIQSRNQIYFSIIKGQKLPTPNIPESFKLLVKKLQGVGLKINVQYGDNKELISCNQFIEKQLNRGINYVYDGAYDTDLNNELSHIVSANVEGSNLKKENNE